MTEHPFAEFVRILGKGKTGSRSLTADEAESAMSMILRDEVEDVQLGAFLMLLRVKEESDQELVGFVRAVRRYTRAFSCTDIDLDWASYAGKRKQLPWYIISALLLASHGYKIVMHGAKGHTPGRLYSEDILHYFGVSATPDAIALKKQFKQSNFCFLPLASFSPQLQRVMDFRHLFGLRSPVHTLARLINPSEAPYSIQSIFHPAYAENHQKAALQLGQEHAAVFKGDGGEAERRPEARTSVYGIKNRKLFTEEWPKILHGRQEIETHLDPSKLLNAWRGSYNSEYANQAIWGTTAICLRLMQKVSSTTEALSLAKDMWQQRDKNYY